MCSFSNSSLPDAATRRLFFAVRIGAVATFVLSIAVASLIPRSLRLRTGAPDLCSERASFPSPLRPST